MKVGLSLPQGPSLTPPLPPLSILKSPQACFHWDCSHPRLCLFILCPRVRSAAVCLSFGFKSLSTTPSSSTRVGEGRGSSLLTAEECCAVCASHFLHPHLCSWVLGVFADLGCDKLCCDGHVVPWSRAGRAALQVSNNNIGTLFFF